MLLRKLSRRSLTRTTSAFRAALKISRSSPFLRPTSLTAATSSLNFRESQSANEGESCASNQISSRRDRMAEALARVAQAGLDIFRFKAWKFFPKLSRREPSRQQL